MAAEAQSWQAEVKMSPELIQDTIETKGKNDETKTKEIQEDKGDMSVMDDFEKFVQRLFTPSSRDDVKVSEVQIEKGVGLSHVLERLECLCRNKIRTNAPDSYNHISILSQSLQNYMRFLQPSELKDISTHITNETSRWLSGLFKLDNVHSHFHQRKIDGLIKVCTLALHSKYSKYATDGFTALYTRPPVIYISGSAPPDFGKVLRNKLGLPQSSICTVQCNTMFGSPYTMDVAALERLLTDDVSCGKTPLILIAYGGTPLAGHTDNLSRLREICTQNGVWFHVEGDNLANLALNVVQPSVQVASNADSLTLNFPHWFGLPTLPYCTFYRTNNLYMAVHSGLVGDEIDKLTALPLWVVTQFMGTQDLYKMIEHSSEMAQQMCHRLDQISNIKRIEQPNGISPVVLFKYKATPAMPLAYDNKDIHGKKPEKLLVAPRGSLDVPSKLKDAFNDALHHHLQLIVPKVKIESVVIPREGLCMKFNPLSTSRKFETCKTDIDEFFEKLREQTTAFDYTIINRTSFHDVFKRVPDVSLIDMPEEPILAAFQCIPKYWKTKNMSNLSDMKKHEANELNMKIFNAIAHQYGHCVDKTTLANGQICIIVKVVNSDFNLQKFAEFVSKCTVEMEDNAKFVESLADTVQKSIEEAQQTLDRAKEEKFFHDDVLRNVPFVSSLYNWYSPPPKENHGVVGRSLDLSSGKLETTDKIYKYKMQIHEDQTDRLSQLSNLSSPTNEPPIAESTLDNQHSESESASSGSETLSENDSNDEDENTKESTENIEQEEHNEKEKTLNDSENLQETNI